MEAGTASNKRQCDQQSPYIAGYRRQQHKINQQQIEHASSHALSIECRVCPGASLTLISHREVECWTL